MSQSNSDAKNNPLPIIQLAISQQERLNAPDWGRTHYQTMQEVVQDPQLWEQWKWFLKMDATMSVTSEEADEPLPHDSVAWAFQQASSSSLVADEKQATQQSRLLWQRCLSTIKERWKSGQESLQYSLNHLTPSPVPVRYRGNLSPVAVFSEVPIAMGDDRCQFSLQQHRVYAFTTYLPTQGYLAVLQVEETNEDVEHALIYPQHATHFDTMGPGTVQLFRTQFDVLGQTQFLLLFSEIPFASLNPVEWEAIAPSWEWDEAAQTLFVRYLLRHSELLEPFLMQVNVVDEGTS